MNSNYKNTSNKPNTPSKTQRVVFLVLTIVVALLIPLLLQSKLNVLFRDLFNPQGWNILIPRLRVISTLVCYAITAAVGGTLLHFSRIRKRWLTILFYVLTFLWTGLVAEMEMIIATD